MEASALTTASHSGLLARRSPLLRLQSDEKLVALIRDGHDRAFEVLFDRYQSRLLMFCRHLVGTVLPSVKSLLVRARMSLAEAGEARILTCDEVRLELAEAAEGLVKVTGPGRRHVRSCERCRRYRGELRSSSRALGALAPFGL